MLSDLSRRTKVVLWEAMNHVRLWAKDQIKRQANAAGWEVRRIPPHTSGTRSSYSFAGEQAILRAFIDRIPAISSSCVDIGAGDGETMSNTYALFRAGWNGLALEADPTPFAKLAHAFHDLPAVHLGRCFVTPENVVALLNGYAIPRDFGVLSLDIDGYDHYVLEQLFTAYRPTIICAEINEKFPPPLRFTVKWSPDYPGRDGQFYGQSLALLTDLATTNGYDLVRLEYNNAFLIRHDQNPFTALTPEEAYRSGYQDRSDRRQRMPWNLSVEPVLTMTPDDALAFLQHHFRKHSGEFVLSLTASPPPP